jgi:hypothetical protein
LAYIPQCDTMVLKGWLMDYKSYDDFVASGDWYIDTQAPDYKEQLYKDVQKQQQAETPQEAAKEIEEGWYE